MNISDRIGSATVVAACLLGPSAVPTLAASTMELICARNWCVRDANNVIVGTNPVRSIGATREINGKPYFIAAFSPPNGLSLTTLGNTYFYASNDCSGQAIVAFNRDSMPPAFYDTGVVEDPNTHELVAGNLPGKFFGPNPTVPPQVLQWQSFSFPAKANRGGACRSFGPNCNGNGGPCEVTGSPAAILESINFALPLTVKFGP